MSCVVPVFRELVVLCIMDSIQPAACHFTACKLKLVFTFQLDEKTYT